MFELFFFLTFSLGFFVGGQVLAGLLGSAVTAGYGASGRHGANYIQTAAASVAMRIDASSRK